MTSRRIRVALAGVLLAGVAVGVLWVVGSRDEPQVADELPPAPQLSGPLGVSPDRLRKGEEFTVTTTDERVVADGFSLAVWDGIGWIYQYQLLGSDEPGDDSAQRWRTWSERTAYVDDVTLGIEPVFLVVPSNAIVGDYRLCVEAPEPPACAGLTVAD